jgi:ribonuclease HI
MDIFTIWTDGSALPQNPGRGGYAAIIINNASREEKVITGCYKHTTNNRMEAMAIINAIISCPDGSFIKVLSDSKYVINSLQKWIPGWKRNGWRKKEGELCKNVDLWEKYLNERGKRKVTFEHVHGHAGIKYNEKVDEIANNIASAQIAALDDEGYFADLEKIKNDILVVQEVPDYRAIRKQKKEMNRQFKIYMGAD